MVTATLIVAITVMIALVIATVMVTLTMATATTATTVTAMRIGQDVAPDERILASRLLPASGRASPASARTSSSTSTAKSGKRTHAASTGAYAQAGFRKGPVTLNAGLRLDDHDGRFGGVRP
mgnify:CR=1 FL=1